MSVEGLPDNLKADIYRAAFVNRTDDEYFYQVGKDIEPWQKSDRTRCIWTGFEALIGFTPSE